MSRRLGGSLDRQSTFIRQWRKHRGLTQEDLAERIGLDTAQVSRIERGASPYTQDTLEAFADALGVQPADLLASDPTWGGSIWGIWGAASVQERARMVRVLAALQGPEI